MNTKHTLLCIQSEAHVKETHEKNSSNTSFFARRLPDDDGLTNCYEIGFAGVVTAACTQEELRRFALQVLQSMPVPVVA